MAKKTAQQTPLDFDRIGQEINVILTEIYGKYVAQGSPTKLGGLRFLDVPSAKTFAFEKTGATKDGNLLVLSAPFNITQPDKTKFIPLAELLEQTGIPRKLKEGPYGEFFKDAIVRASYDRGKAGKFFVEISYHLPTGEWLCDDNIFEYTKQHGCNTHEAVVSILRQHVLPIADAIMDHFIQLVRDL